MNEQNTTNINTGESTWTPKIGDLVDLAVTRFGFGTVKATGKVTDFHSKRKFPYEVTYLVPGAMHTPATVWRKAEQLTLKTGDTK